MSTVSGLVTTSLGPVSNKAAHFFTAIGQTFVASATMGPGAAYTVDVPNGTYKVYVENGDTLLFPDQWVTGGATYADADLIVVAGDTSLDLLVLALDEEPAVEPTGTAWPELDELKQLLDITSEDWDGDAEGTHLTRLLLAAIDRIKLEIAGTVDAYDALYTEPTDAHAQAALRMAELLATRPDVSPNVRLDPTLRRLLFGQRRVFGVA